MPIWIMLIPELLKIILQIWLEIRKKPAPEAEQARSEMRAAFKDCPDGKCEVAKAKLKERLEAILGRLRK